MTSRRLVSFAGTAIALEYEGPVASSVVHFLCADLDHDAAIQPTASFELRSAVPEGMLRLTTAGVVLSDCDTPGGIASQLACEIAGRLADRSAGGMLYHAAAVAWGSKGVVIPGSSGAGKTTLSAHLVHQGFSYLSDEMAYVPLDSTTVEGFGRPLSLKPGAWPALEDELRAAPDADVLATSDGFLVRPGRLNRATTHGRFAISLLIFPRRGQGATVQVRRLTKAEAALALLGNLVNARNLPGHGLAQVTRLARTVPAYAAVYDDAATIAPIVRSLLSEHP